MSEFSRRFPLETDTQNRPRVTFFCHQWKHAKPDIQNANVQVTNSVGDVTLFLPSNTKETYTANWGDEKIPTLQSPEALIGQSTATVADKAGLSGLYNAGKWGTGETIYPFEVAMFTHVSPIPLNFTFELIPKNIKESEEIDSIVTFFKTKMLPTFGGPNSTQFLMSFPHGWTIQFQNIIGMGFPDTPTKYRHMALTVCDVNYGGSEQSALTYNSKYPIALTLSLQFISLRHAFLNGP